MRDLEELVSAVALRPYSDGIDQGFLAASAIVSSKGSDLRRFAPDSEQSFIDDLVVSYMVHAHEVTVCHVRGSGDDLIGWVAGTEGKLVNGIYVKPAFRRLGVATFMLDRALGIGPSTEFAVSMLTRDMRKLLRGFSAWRRVRG